MFDASSAAGAASTCSPSTFTVVNVFGSDILSISANLVSNYTATAPYQTTVHYPTIEVRDAEFCNVTVAYTHPEQSDHINVEIWLPIGNWNERLMAVGGGGCVAGRFSYSETMMAAAIGQGYATVTTDAGLGIAFYPEEWALLSPGNVNLYALQNLASTSLNDEACDLSPGYLVILTDLTAGHYRQDSHLGLLWQASEILLLEWLLPGRPPRS